MKSIIRKWQAGEKTPELAKQFQDLSAKLVDFEVCKLDDADYETVHDINNFIQTQWLFAASQGTAVDTDPKSSRESSGSTPKWRNPPK